MAQIQPNSHDEHGEFERKTEDEDDEIDIVGDVGIKTDEIHVENDSRGLSCDSDKVSVKNSDVGEIENSKTLQNKAGEEDTTENCIEDMIKEQHNIDSSPTGAVEIKESQTSRTMNNNDNDESSCPSRTTSSCSSRVSSRQNSANDSEMSKNIDVDFEMKERLFSDGLGSQQVSDGDDDDDDNDDFKESGPYERFFFESDYLALKDNKHYHQLLQTLVALEGQRMQAIKDLDSLCEEEAKALDDPIGFVEKLQNNEPLGLPMAQNVIKLPKIPWEVYATSLGPVDMSLPTQHHTRAALSYVEKVTGSTSAAQSSSAGSTLSTPQETHATPSLFTSERSNRESDVMLSESLNKNNDSGRLPTFNLSWTTEEQTRLEKLLQLYPQEEIESKRWEKIAKALGNRTPKQVASRIQKYFIKLAKAGLPIPGRVPNIPRSGSRIAKRSTHYQTMGFRTSTFFPSYQPRVYMDDNKDDDDAYSVAFSDDTSCQSDDESIPEELKQTRDYMELMELKKIKRQKLRHDGDQQASTSHTGYVCDGCGTSPIVGSRWHCQDCPQEASMDFCSSCVERRIPESRGHSRHHRLEQITKETSYFIDGDYVGMTGSAATGYNYLDPNFLPAAS